MEEKTTIMRNNGLDIMKSIAMFFVVILHSVNLTYGGISFAPLCRWAVPCFL